LAKGPYEQDGSQGFHLKLFPYVYLAFPSVLYLADAYEPDMQANQLIRNERQRKPTDFAMLYLNETECCPVE